jgi:hypothetical protein
MIDEAAIRLRWDAVCSRLDERGRRVFAAAEVRTAGRGGLAIVSKITGLARSTINRGKADLGAQPLPKGRVRRAGGGRRSVCENDPGLIPALKRLVEPATLGDTMRPLIWVSKSMEKLAATLTEMGHPISADTVCTELVKLGFSRQSNRKANDGSKHPDRNAQFDHINAKVVAADPRPPLSAGHIKVEQDRAPAVLPHHAELARPAAHRSARRGRVDRGDDDQDRPESRKCTRHPHLPEGHQDQQSRNEMPRHHRRSIPS